MATGKKFVPFWGKESKKEEDAEKKVGKKAYAKGEKAEGEKGFAKGGSVSTRLDPRVERMMRSREAEAISPAKARAAAPMYKCGGAVKKMARGGGIETKGKTKGKMF